MKIKATVFFGREREKKVRTFATHAELHAYIRGVDDSNGWMEYSISEGTKGAVGRRRVRTVGMLRRAVREREGTGLTD